jgi:Cu+-exporting ATPase
VRALQAGGNTVMYLARGKAVEGLVAVADPVKASAAQAVKALHAQGYRIVMATGDNEVTAGP